MSVNRSGFRGTLGNLNGRPMNSPCRQGKLLPPARSRWSRLPGPVSSPLRAGAGPAVAGPDDLAGTAV